MNGSEGHLYKSKIKPEVAVYLDEHYPGFFEEVLRLARSFISFYGETTADGAADGSTLICSDLTDQPDFDGNQVVILSGEYDGQARDIDGTTTAGTVTPHLAFGGQIVSGTRFVILALRTVPAEVAGLVSDVADIEAKLDHGTHGLAALKTLIDAIEAKLDDGTTGLAALKVLIDAAEAKLDKLSGSEADTQVAGKDLTAAGGGTSGENGADILTISTTTRKKVHMLTVSMKNCQAAATITVRMYTKVNGSWEKFYHQAFTQGTDPDAIMAINGTLAVLADLRVEMHSSDALDNNLTIPYSYILEDME